MSYTKARLHLKEKKSLSTSTRSPAEPWPPGQHRDHVNTYLGRLVDKEYSICLLLSVLFWLKNISYLFTWNTLGERERSKETEWEKDRKRRQCHQIIYIFFKTFFNHKLISERETCPETSRLSVRIYRKFEHHILDQAQEGDGALRQRPQWLVGVNTEADDWLASGQVAQQLVSVLLSAMLLKKNSLVDSLDVLNPWLITFDLYNSESVTPTADAPQECKCVIFLACIRAAVSCVSVITFW